MPRLTAVIRDRLRWGVFSALLLLAGSAWTIASRVPAAATTGGRIPSPRPGFLAPDFTLDRLDGEPLTLSDLRGKAVVLNLWASWCPPCQAEMPALQAAFEQDGGRGLVVVALNTTFQDREAGAAAFVEQYGLTFPIVLDRDGSTSRQYLLRALPSTFFIDPDGVITQVVIGGPMSEATIRSAVAELLDRLP